MTTFYTVFGQPSSPATLTADNGTYTMGMQFTLSAAAALTGVWFYSPPGAADLPDACGIFAVTGPGSGTVVSGTGNLSPSWSGAAGSGWVKCSYDGSITLTAGTAYKVAISHGGSGNFYGDTAHYWDSSGAGTNGLTFGIITAPNNAGADIGQDSYATAASLTYPAATFDATNYWVDVEVATAGNIAGAAAGAGTAAQPGVTANLTVFPGAAAGGGVSGPAFAGPSTGVDDGQFGPYTYPPITSSNDDTVINNNVWNGGDAPGWTQVLTAASPGVWGVVANMTNGTGSVVSYPDVQQFYYEKPLSSWASMTSSWNEIMTTDPSTDLAEAAYDTWLNNFGNEVMIWVDITPLQRNTLNFVTFLGQVTIGGQLMNYYHGGGATEIIYALVTNQPAGTVDVLGVWHHAAAHGLIPANSGVTAVEFGWEISTTNGVDRTFSLSSFSITETFTPPPAILSPPRIPRAPVPVPVQIPIFSGRR